jgi:FAD synthase
MAKNTFKPWRLIPPHTSEPPIGLHTLPKVTDRRTETIGNFDGVHRGHQAMLALLNSEAAQRGVPSCVLTFEPHPRDYFAGVHRKPDLAPARIGTLRDKLASSIAAACSKP